MHNCTEYFFLGLLSGINKYRAIKTWKRGWNGHVVNCRWPLPCQILHTVRQTLATFKYKPNGLKCFSIDNWGGGQMAGGLSLHNWKKSINLEVKKILKIFFKGSLVDNLSLFGKLFYSRSGTKINLAWGAVRFDNELLLYTEM